MFSYLPRVTRRFRYQQGREPAQCVDTGCDKHKCSTITRTIYYATTDPYYLLLSRTFLRLDPPLLISVYSSHFLVNCTYTFYLHRDLSPPSRTIVLRTSRFPSSRDGLTSIYVDRRHRFISMKTIICLHPVPQLSIVFVVTAFLRKAFALVSMKRFKAIRMSCETMPWPLEIIITNKGERRTDGQIIPRECAKGHIVHGHADRIHPEVASLDNESYVDRRLCKGSELSMLSYTSSGP